MEPLRARTFAKSHLPAPVLRAARRLKAELDRLRFQPRVVSHSYAGNHFSVHIASAYANVYDRDWPELGEIAFLKQHRLRPGARVFNLGANHGIVAMMLAAEVGSEGQVVALEAHPRDAAAAARNRDLNDLPQLLCLHAAVASSSGELDFALQGEVDDGCGRWASVRVPALSINTLVNRYGAPDVMFIDVEGYELEALRGASASVQSRPDWFVEVHEPEALARYGATQEQVIDWFQERDYTCFVAEDLLGRTSEGILVSLTSFRHLDDPDELPVGRFFLAAVSEPAVKAGWKVKGLADRAGEARRGPG